MEKCFFFLLILFLQCHVFATPKIGDYLNLMETQFSEKDILDNDDEIYGYSFLNSEQLEPELVQQPKARECYPASPYSKKYISTDKGWFYTTRTFSCEYSCVNHNLEIEVIRGTSVVKRFNWVDDDGRQMVCRGYEKDMKWVDEFNNPARLGYYIIDKVRPFNARTSGIPELREWSLQN